MKVYWRCDLCNVTGVCTHAPAADVSTVANLLATSHSKRSPSCRYDLGKMRVSWHRIRPLRKPT